MCEKKVLHYNAETNKQIKKVREEKDYNKDTPRQHQYPGSAGLDALIAKVVQALAVDTEPDDNIISGTGMVEGEIEQEHATKQQAPVGNSNSPEQDVNGAAVAVAVTPRTAEKGGV